MRVQRASLIPSSRVIESSVPVLSHDLLFEVYCNVINDRDYTDSGESEASSVEGSRGSLALLPACQTLSTPTQLLPLLLLLLLQPLLDNKTQQTHI